jgi:hypothetical protein
MRKWQVAAAVSILCFSLLAVLVPKVEAANALSIVASIERQQVYAGHYSLWTIGDDAYVVTANVASGGSPVAGVSVVADIIGPNGEAYWLRDGTQVLYDRVQGRGMDESGWISGPIYGGTTNDGIYANFLELDANPANMNAMYFGNHPGTWTIRLTASKQGYRSASTEVTLNIVQPTGNFGHSFKFIDLDTSTLAEDWVVYASPGQTLNAKLIYDETNKCGGCCVFYIRAWGCPYEEWGDSYDIDSGCTGYRSNVERTWAYTVPSTPGIYTITLADIFAYWWPFYGESADFVGKLVVGQPGPAQWTTQTVDSQGDVGQYASLAIDSWGRPHISYYDATNKELKYAKWTGSEWVTRTVDKLLIGCRSCSIALDADDNPRIAYGVEGPLMGQVRYAVWNGADWDIQEVDSKLANIGDISLALDSNNKPHIVYSWLSLLQSVVYAKSDGTTWQFKTVDWTPAFPPTTKLPVALALDSDDNPHIAYFLSRAPYARAPIWWGSLCYATCDQGEWSSTTVDSWPGGVIPCTRLGLVVESTGTPDIIYKYNVQLKHARRTTSNLWNVSNVDALNTIDVCPSTAIDLQGNIRLSYGDYSNGKTLLKYAVWNADGWTKQTAPVDSIQGGSKSVVMWTSIAVDSTGAPRIAYYDYPNGDLKYAFLS